MITLTEKLQEMRGALDEGDFDISHEVAFVRGAIATIEAIDSGASYSDVKDEALRMIGEAVSRFGVLVIEQAKKSEG